jgi:TPR repeat protein
MMQAEGEGVPQNDAEAVKWFRLAAEQDYADAQFFLGGMYGLGRGVPVDNVEAYMWVSLAAARGVDTMDTAAEIAKRMSREQIAEAQRRAAEWSPKAAN